MKYFESRYIENWQEMGPILRTGSGIGLTGPKLHYFLETGLV